MIWIWVRWCIWFLFNLPYRDLEGVIWLCGESGASRRQFFGSCERQEATNQAGIESIFKIMNVIGGRLSLVVRRIAFSRHQRHERRSCFEES
jgi:hypothetical protein